jgi:predicted dehydrogenase
MSLRIGVVGCGVHGMHHVRLLTAREDAVLAGVYDSDPKTAEQVSADHGVTAYGTLAELLKNVDAVSVVSPTTTHHDIVMTALGAGCHVLVEKPIAATVSEADEMVAEAKRLGLVLAVGHIERFNAAFRSVSALGMHPLFIESHRLAAFNPRGTDVAVVLDLMIHDIDIVLALVRRPVTALSANGVSVASDEVDIANARIEFVGGCVANLTASRISQKKMRKVRSFQRNAYISMDCLTGESEVFSLDPERRPAAEPGTPPSLMEGISYKRHPNDGGNALDLELADFIRAIRDGDVPRVTGADGREALSVAMRVLDSVAESLRSIG